LQKHGLPFNVYVKLLHIHSHQEDGNIVAWSEFDAPLIGKIPFLAPLTPTKNTLVRGCHFLVDYTGDLQAFGYTTNMDCVDLAAYPAMVSQPKAGLLSVEYLFILELTFTAWFRLSQ